MSHSPERRDNIYPNLLVFLGKLVATIYVAIFLIFGIGNALYRDLEVGLEGIVLALLISVAAAGVVLAWLNRPQASWILLTSGILMVPFAVLAAGSNDASAVLVASGPLVFAGASLILGQRNGRHAGSAH
jgi:hypothetical protein